jgi:5-bromo-4-chloroindolyl phosphate hydrolysis protein
VDARHERIGKNEAIFREVNDRIERVSDSLQVKSESIAILCECGDESCVERIEISRADYERVRRDPTLFFVCKGHDERDVEDVVEQHDRYDVMRKKRGEPAELARELNPRKA